MALNTYSALQTSIGDWLNRTDLAAVIPDFITLCEAEIKRDVQRGQIKTTITVNAETVSAPADMAELRDIYLYASDEPEQDVPIRINTPSMLAESKARHAGVAGRPTDVSVVAGSLKFSPPPDENYTAEIVYYQTLQALSNFNSTNAVLNEAPDIYLWGSLKQAAPYLENDDRMALWEKLYDDAVTALNEKRDREEYGGAIKSVRLPITFGTW